MRWERPEITGRDDFYYNIFYSEDNQTFTQHNRRPYVKQDTLVDYSVSGLRPLTTYTIRVIPENGVSGQEEGGQSRSCEVVAMTGDTSECLEAMEIKYTDIVYYLNYSQWHRKGGAPGAEAPPPRHISMAIYSSCLQVEK